MDNIATQDLARIYRVPLRSQRASEYGLVDHTKQVEHCLKKRLVGLGWGVWGDSPPKTLAETLARVEARGWTDAVATIRRFAAAENGSLVWSRHTDGTWLLGKLNGRFRTDYSRAASEVDVYQVRHCDWIPKRILSEEVPGDVIRRFSGRGSSFSEIHSQLAQAYSNWLFAQLTGESVDIPTFRNVDVLAGLLDPYDVEDLVYVYLQVARNYLVIPASRRTDTAAYEYALINRETKRLAVVQVKTGTPSVDLDQLASTAGDDRDAFAYSTTGNYEGRGGDRVHRLTDQQLLRFARSHPDLLPPRVRRWLEFARR